MENTIITLSEFLAIVSPTPFPPLQSIIVIIFTIIMDPRCPKRLFQTCLKQLSVLLERHSILILPCSIITSLYDYSTQSIRFSSVCRSLFGCMTLCSNIDDQTLGIFSGLLECFSQLLDQKWLEYIDNRVKSTTNNSVEICVVLEDFVAICEILIAYPDTHVHRYVGWIEKTIQTTINSFNRLVQALQTEILQISCIDAEKMELESDLVQKTISYRLSEKRLIQVITIIFTSTCKTYHCTTSFFNIYK